ncbi:hypothetical protein BDY21DRAFT_365243 [Lineolata rhizophorae]|uniref:P-loop containing nucleoside triphosphate hydrolase protein n=1 Tax=Lineolata rhizophorae TaxID=578093 RepID=A0A6A6NUS3_9PEZI|nr:hypothetical protein BDY21DRAFT_365243 [Lineolata rhizophorae]
MAAATPARDDTPASPTTEDAYADLHPVLQWYRWLSSRRVDLVGDYAGNERFLIEGDSLLLHCFSDPEIDFQDGFQLLHAVYVVEKLLKAFVRRKCVFDIAFFERHKTLCIPSFGSKQSAKYLLAREAVIRHIQNNLDPKEYGVQLFCFDSYNSSEFVDYLHSSGMYFIMCHDGAASKQETSMAAYISAENRRSDVPDAKTYFRAMIASFISLGYNVALINGLELRDTKIMTMVLEGSRRSLPPNVDALSDALSSLSLTNGSANGTDASSAMNILSGVLDGKRLTEREGLALLTIQEMVNHGQANATLALAFLLHLSVLSQLKVTDRGVPDRPVIVSGDPFMTNFAITASRILRTPLWSNIAARCASCDVSDLVDGRIFNTILNSMEDDFNLDAIDGTLKSKALMLVQAAQKFSSEMQSLLEGPLKAPQDHRDPRHHTKDGDIHPSLAVLPFSNPVFDNHMDPIRLKVDKHASEVDPRAEVVFKEISHWHSHRKPIDRPAAMAEEKKKAFWANKRNQWFMAEMQTYSASLTNSIGRVLEPETIVIQTGKGGTKPTAARQPSAPAKEIRSAGGKQDAKGKKGVPASGGKAVRESAAASRAHKQEQEVEKWLKAWDVSCKQFQAEKDLQSRYAMTKAYLSTLADQRRAILGPEVELYMLDTLLQLWIKVVERGKKDEEYSLAAIIWDSVSHLSQTSKGMTKSVAVRINAAVKALSLPTAGVEVPKEDRPLSFPFVLDNARDYGDLTVRLSSNDFQLSHCGPYFDRSMGSAPDDRVPFEPDEWQRKVLDEIDKNRSLFVVAPTSAGKTFISFYAMKQVLQADDDGVLVYVAPTKALVNQIAAEIQARFSKSYKYPGKSVWGIHTRDYRINNPTGCQILVTVPHVLQIMLLAPSHANTWSPRVKRIIFDEVHSIGQAEDGVVWEQLLLMAPCPIIALSATVGNPQQFNNWLSSTQKSNGIDLTMVQHSVRYSELRKYVYQPPKKFCFKGLTDRPAFGALSLDGTPNFAFMHPVASLVNRSRGIPDDLSLEPRDCLILWECLNKHQTPDCTIDKSLDPSVIFSGVEIKKADIIPWEAKLKDILQKWMADNNSPFDKVIEELSKPIYSKDRQPRLLSTSVQSGLHDGQEELPGEEDFRDVIGDDLYSTTLPLLSRLHSQNCLPALLFNYDRKKCESICRVITEQLVESEKKYKESSPKWKHKIAQHNRWKKEQEKQKKKPVRATQKKGAKVDEEGLSKADLQREKADVDTSPWASFDPDAPVENFHFADFKKVQMSELYIYYKQLGKRNVPQWLSDALSRGIGVHHAGMNRKYRQIVEMLFRRGFLRVVIATGTLALGINMPTKTVVFSGDSVFLTALNFRQAAGRAGRRGFDVLGNVVFQNVPLAKVTRLISSRLPDLNGHFPITTSLVLRLCTLLSESKNSKFAIKAIDGIMSQPRLYMGGEEAKDTVLHHLRFSIEYLRRQNLLDSKGTPLNFAGCVSHLYYAENASFAFHALLKEGYFHELCANIDRASDSTLNKLMLVMSHLFGRLPCRQADPETVDRDIKPSSSVVFLPPLPKEASRVLKGHNRQTLDIFTTYVRTFVQQHIKEEENSLPLTGVKVGGKGSDEVKKYVKTNPPNTVRSAFVGLSGHQDAFDSISDLCRTARDGVFLEEAVIPYVDLHPEENPAPINAYLYDFFKHGDIKTLERANKIRVGDVWFLLNDFSLVLATIITSLMNFMKLSQLSDLDMLDVKGSGDTYEETREDRINAETGSTSTSASSTAASSATWASSSATSVSPAGSADARPPTPTIRRKKKVAESWDEEMGDESSSEEEEEEEEKDKMLKDTSFSSPELLDIEDAGLDKVLRAFQRLANEFNKKFRAMWA